MKTESERKTELQFILERAEKRSDGLDLNDRVSVRGCFDGAVNGPVDCLGITGKNLTIIKSLMLAATLNEHERKIVEKALKSYRIDYIGKNIIIYWPEKVYVLTSYSINWTIDGLLTDQIKE